jgi:hypothetical protein
MGNAVAKAQAAEIGRSQIRGQRPVALVVKRQRQIEWTSSIAAASVPPRCTRRRRPGRGTRRCAPRAQAS